jgi:hypothetical protein
MRSRLGRSLFDVISMHVAKTCDLRHAIEICKHETQEPMNQSSKTERHRGSTGGGDGRGIACQQASFINQEL